MINNLQDFLEINDREVIKFKVKHWDQEIYLRPLSAGHAKLVADKSRNDDGSINLGKWSLLLVGYSLVNEKGDLLLREEQFEKLNEKSVEAINEIAIKVLEINNMNLDLDDIAKN